MKLRYRIALGLLGIALIAWIIFSSESFHNCIYQAKNTDGNQTFKEYFAFIYIAIRNLFGCTGQFFEDHSPAVTAIATVVIGGFTWALSSATTGMLRGAADQTAKLSKSADAMDRVATAMNTNLGLTQTIIRNQEVFAKSQIRAYLSMAIGGGFFQERADGKGKHDLFFSVHPEVINTGHTPAHNVKFRAKAQILPSPLLPNIGLPLQDEWHGGAVLGPGQKFVINANIGGFIDDARAEIVKAGTGAERLYIWGEITYEDIFSKPHWVKFCQTIHWLPNGGIFGYYTDHHNETDRDPPI